MSTDKAASFLTRFASCRKFSCIAILRVRCERSTFTELAARYGVPTSYEPGDKARALATQRSESVYRFNGFQEFLFKFAAVCRSLQQADDYVRILHEYAQDALANGVMYAELTLSPSAWLFFHKRLDALGVLKKLSAAANEIEGRYGLRIRFIIDITRNFGREKALESVQFAHALRDHGIVGIGLGGDEANFPAPLFEEAFRKAREFGLHAVAHAGEAAGAESVRDAVMILQVERIGHGIRALEDLEVIELLKQRNITLEICPTSNYRTGVVPQNRPHPLAELHRAGVPLTIDSDDPAIFETDITREYAYAESIAGIDAVLAFARRGIDASFTDLAMRTAMADKQRNASVELLRARRT